MTQAAAKLSFKEKVGYSLGDMAANFIFQAMLALQLDFYTDTFGLTAAQAGTLFLVVGLGVACFNPVMGMIADRTTTRWGKFRPWLLWTAVPFGVISVLTFTTPHLSLGAKIIYAWTTYILLRLIYTVNNVPYASLTAVMTEDPDERTSIASYRQIVANSAGFIIASLAIPMVKFFGRGNDALGYQFTMGLLSVLSMRFFHHRLLHDERAHPAQSAAENLARPGSRGPLQQSALGRAVSGHLVLLHGDPGARQCHAALLQICRRQCQPLRLVQRFRPRFVTPGRRLLHSRVCPGGQASALHREHDPDGRLQRGAVCDPAARHLHRHRHGSAAASSRSDCRARSYGR